MKRVWIVSILVFVILLPLGAVNHQCKAFLAIILYTISTIYTSNILGLNHWRKAVVILLLPIMVFYIPIHILTFQSSSIGLLSTIAHFIGILFGLLILRLRTKKTILNIFVGCSLIFSLVFSFYFYNYWLTYVSYGTFTGKVNESIPKFKLVDSEGKIYTEAFLDGKIVLFDFWTTSCGICFQKFPILQSLSDKFNSEDDKVVIYSVNVPIARDTLNQAFAIIKKREYTFKTLVDIEDTAGKNFNIYAYPTVLVLKDKRVIFRGEIEGAEELLSTLNE